MEPTKTIYLIRHGETEFNRLGIVQGSGVDSELNEKGQRQAQSFFEHYADVDFDKIYTSALKRTWQSVQAFIDKGIEHLVVPELNEISWGDYEGRESNPHWKMDYYRMIEGWGRGELHLSVPNGESPLELHERQKKAMNIIVKDENVKTALVCMHGRAMKGFLCLLLDRPLTSMEDFPHSNLCLYKLEYKAGRFSLIKANCVEHLESRMSA